MLTLKDQKGTVIVLFALTLTVLLGFTALAIDIGDLYVGRNELQNAADAAALAGALLLPDTTAAGNNSATVVHRYHRAKYLAHHHRFSPCQPG